MSFLLKEDGGKMLQETGDRILLEILELSYSGHDDYSKRDDYLKRNNYSKNNNYSKRNDYKLI